MLLRIFIIKQSHKTQLLVCKIFNFLCILIVSMKSIRTQMISLIVVVCVIVFFGLNYSIEQKLNELKNHTITQYLDITESRANEVSKELVGIINQVRMISNSTIIQSMDLNVIKDYLRSLIEDSNIRSMTISDIYGKAWTTYDAEIDISDQEQFKSIIINQKEWIISNPFHSPYFFEDIPIITISHQIRVNGEVVGLLNAVVTTEFMNRITESIQFKNLSFAWIIDSNGKIVSHPNEAISIDQSYSNILQYDESNPFIRNSGSFNYLDENNRSMLAVYSTIPNTSGWKLIISIENRNAFAELTSAMNYVDYALLISLVILILFALIYANSISEPILRLRHVFERAEKGDLNVKADESVKNEIGLAGVSFNHMLQEIKNLTYVDPVTQIGNYRSYLSESNFIIQSNKDHTYYVVVISIDDFKKINSLGGYGFGNETLKKFAELIRSQLHEDEIVARYFGDEMILLLKENDLEVLRERISVLLKECQRPFIIMDIDIHLSISCGIARHIPTESIEMSIHNSTIAKLKAKKMGGNVAIFYGDGINQEIKLEQDIEKELYHAIDRNELYLVYQPIFDLNTMKVSGFEALLRWNHPVYNSHRIDSIIKIAENSGQMPKIGRWVMKEACYQLKTLNESFPDLSIAINVSVVQFNDSYFIKNVEEILKYTKINRKNLIFEITESSAMNNVDENLNDLKRLRDLGIGLSIDDFGTGYSSLAYLSQFPIDHIKIDRNFIRKMTEESSDLMLVKTMITLAKSLHLDVIAEGVESLEEMNLLKSLECDKIQGYLISKPKRMKDLEIVS